MHDSGFAPEWTMGDRLRKIRRRAKMTQAQFAGALGVADDTYGAWESDRNKVTDVVAVAKRIKVLTGTPVWWTLDTQEGPRPAGPDGGSEGGPRQIRTDDLRIKSP